LLNHSIHSHYDEIMYSEIYTLSLHDALPILKVAIDLLAQTGLPLWWGILVMAIGAISALLGVLYALAEQDIKRLLAWSTVENVGDRKSTRLNSSHVSISYAVFCSKKKKNQSH